eukprot:11355551-Karenia_brevis.AAC.1
MAQARGRPRPGTAHPDSIPDDPDGVQGGGREDDDVRFDVEDALPGGNGQVDDQDVMPQTIDPELQYRAQYAVPDDQVFDIVHRLSDIEKHRCNSRSQKRQLLDRFMNEHAAAYTAARHPHSVKPDVPGAGAAANTTADQLSARRRQQDFIEARKAEDMSPEATAPAPAHGVKRRLGDPEALEQGSGLVRQLD